MSSGRRTTEYLVTVTGYDSDTAGLHDEVRDRIAATIQEAADEGLCWDVSTIEEATEDEV